MLCLELTHSSQQFLSVCSFQLCTIYSALLVMGILIQVKMTDWATKKSFSFQVAFTVSRLLVPKVPEADVPHPSIFSLHNTNFQHQISYFIIILVSQTEILLDTFLLVCCYPSSLYSKWISGHRWLQVVDWRRNSRFH